MKRGRGEEKSFAISRGGEERRAGETFRPPPPRLLLLPSSPPSPPSLPSAFSSSSFSPSPPPPLLLTLEGRGRSGKSIQIVFDPHTARHPISEKNTLLSSYSVDFKFMLLDRSGATSKDNFLSNWILGPGMNYVFPAYFDGCGCGQDNNYFHLYSLTVDCYRHTF